MGDFKREARAEVLARWLFRKKIYFAFGETVRTLLTGNCFLASWPARLFGLVTSSQPGYVKRRPDKPSQIILPHNTRLHMARLLSRLLMSRFAAPAGHCTDGLSSFPFTEQLPWLYFQSQPGRG